MRRFFKVSMLCLAAGVVGACRPDEVIQTENIPTAGLRFLNAVPDTLPMDFRFIDRVESNAHFRIAFRNNPVSAGSGAAAVVASTFVQYKNARAGTRDYRVFLNDTSSSVATFVVDEGQLTLEQDRLYTFLIWGYGDPAGPNRPPNAPPMRVDFFEETVTVPTDQVALRVINATMNAIDVRHREWDQATPGAPTWANIAPLSISAYVNVPPDTMVFNVQPAGGGTTLFADARALIGTPPNYSGARLPSNPNVFLPCGGTDQPKCDTEATPGTTIAGSAITAIVFPGSVACSKAPQTGGGATPFQFTTGNTANLSATATGFGRSSGSFTTDAIPTSGVIGVCGFTNPANNGLFLVTGRTATTITATRLGTGAATVPEPGVSTSTGNFAATPTGYTRVTGSFVTEGWQVGQTISASGFTASANNGVGTVSAVAPTLLTVTRAATAPALVTEAATTGSISLAATATGYTRSTGDFVAEGWQVGQSITASGFVTPANNGTSTIVGVTPTALTVTKVGGTVAEVELPGRTISSAASRSISNADIRQIAAERPLISFIWDRRPPRHPQID
jgi:hypothetical protein